MKERRSILGHMTARVREGASPSAVAIVYLDGRMTFGDGDELFKKIIDQLLARGSLRVVVDMGNLSYMDSSGVDAVVRSYNKLAERNGKLRLVVTTDRIKNLFEITKLLTVIEIFGTEEEALADFKA
ncbi:MAG: STAS domain-containing protein [Acidobacteriota bacterium]